MHLHQLVVGQTFSPRQTMQEITTVNGKVDMMWQLHIEMFGQLVYAFRNSPLFFIYRTMYAFFEVHGPFSSEFINFLSTSFVNQLWSLAHCPYSRGIGLYSKTQPNIFDLRVFRCICLFDGEQFAYLGVCMEIRVAHIVIDNIMSKTVFHTF